MVWRDHPHGQEARRTGQPEDLLQDILGRLLLVTENQGRVREVIQVVQENWRWQAEVVDPLHRPHYVLTQCKKDSAVA